MAEAVVSFTVEKLGSLLINEAIFLGGVHDQVEEIGRELTRMQCFLKDADAKGAGDERIRNWVREIRAAAYDVEDVLDTFILKVARRRRRGLTGYVKRCPCIFNEMIALHKVGKEIQAIQKKISSISASRLTYGIENLGRGKEGTSLVSENFQVLRRPSSEKDVVGFDEDVKALVARLTQGEQRRCVISIVGTGGLGKTTLALKLFSNYDIKRHFNSCAWVVVTQEYKVRKVLQDVAEKMMRVGSGELEKMSTEDLGGKLFEYLSDKRYLVVMDDVWRRELWEHVKAAFPDANNGSRVLFTTRNNEVAVSADPSSLPHELHFLDEKQSWELFLKQVFPLDGELANLGKQIVAKAGGLPLAILALAGLLLKKQRNPIAWLEVLSSVNWELTEGRERISNILALSYLDLPYYLKSCFLYFSVFPKDYGSPEADFEIYAETLVQLWVAEGFIQQHNQAKSMEDGAEDYLEELADRNLIRVVKRNPIGKVEKCRMHDLLRELAIFEAKNNDFSSNTASEAPNIRRFAIKDDTVSYSDLNRSNTHLRALLWLAPNTSASLSISQSMSICRSFKLLRVVIISGPDVSTVPYDIGKLIHLTYLEWWADFPEYDGIPTSIGNLQQLQTLCLSSSKEFYVPNSVLNLPQLRFVWFGRPGHALIKGRPNKVSSFNLQTLSRVETGPWMEDCLGKFTSLRRLEMWGDFTMFGDVLNSAIVKMKSLRILKLVGHKGRIKTLVPLSQHLYIFKMHLEGRLEKLPDVDEYPPNLTQVILIGSEYERDPLPTLEKLPNLTFLELMGKSYVGEKLVCSASGFPRLQELTLSSLPKLKEWKVEKGAMPILQRLVIVGCDQLEELPEGLQHVTGLRELELIAMPVEFRNRVVENAGEDWYKIQHIPFLK